MAGNSWALQRGLHDPTEVTPARLPASVRRTTAVSIVRPDGPDGPLRLDGNGRDLGTRNDDSTVLFDTAQGTVEVDYVGDRTIVSAIGGHAGPDLTALVGSRASSGFRSVLAEALPDDARGHSLLYRVLDDVPVATVISGYALTREARPIKSGGRPRPGAGPQADYCAGFATGGVFIGGIEANGAAPVVIGPPAPDVVHGSDPLAWHHLDGVPAKGMRRIRRIDVHENEDDAIAVDAMFRDSYVDENRAEMVLHEYHLDLTAHADTLVITSAVATPRVLPWPECTGALVGVSRLVDRTLPDVAQLVGSEFRGVESCTHLNDLLRSLADVVDLATKLKALR